MFAALIAALNTKLPDIGQLLIHRAIAKFQRAFRRNSKVQCKSTLVLLAHLVNQQVVHEVLALELLSLFLTKPTEDSIELAAEFMQ